MEYTAADFALLSDERKAEISSVFQLLMQRNERMEQEAVRLEQDVLSLGNEFAAMDRIPEERRAHVRETLSNLQMRSEGVKQERDALRNELVALGFGGMFATSSDQDQTLNPTLWSTLPHELQQNVFAQLPLRQIVRLQTLDLAWHHYVKGVAGAIPDFMKKWAEINPKMFGMLCEGHDYDDAGIVAVRLYDSDSKKWCRFKHLSIFEEFIDMMHAGDGGLVCIVPLASDKQEWPLSIVVLNPLTRQWRELPELPPALLSDQPQMVQLVMDREAMGYKVLVVGPRDMHLGGEGVSIYSSVTGEWSSPETSRDIIFGYRHCFDDYGDLEFFSVTGRSPCAYDCLNGNLLELDNDQSPWRTLKDATSYALVHERLYVLHNEAYQYDHTGVVEERQRYCISEYQAQAEWRQLLWNQPHLTCEVNWTKLKVHACDAFEDLMSDSHMHLYACNGNLLVTSDVSDLAWLCRDLSSNKWETISGVSKSIHDEGAMAMFELQWDAVP